MTDRPDFDFADLKAVTINCTLKPGSEASHTGTLLALVESHFSQNGVTVDRVRTADHCIAPGVQPDMTEHGFARDDWPSIWPRIEGADIVVIGSPIWLGEKSSECTRLIERLYAHSDQTNAKGQPVFYGKVGGCVMTGNEDGYKHVGMNLVYSLQHIGFTIPPQCDAAWVGEAGPGPSYGDETEDGTGRVGFDNEFTLRNATFMAWNLMHMARLLKDAGGLPGHGNSMDRWEAGERFGAPGGATPQGGG